MMAEHPSPEQPVLKVEDISKTFKFYPTQSGRLKEWLTFGKRSYHQDFSALSGISFQVQRGDFLGIIGPNGAGKSTLLKVITGVLDATSGSYRMNGKVLSLLELSGGMDGDLTGRENIVRSAQLLGFPSNYAQERMQQIAEFSELGEFFDRPIMSYSSGMRVRLAFSLFAFLDCDILILDEVLAVGDMFFKQKCYERLEQLIAKQVAIILVTHSTGVVRRYCNNVLVLNKGRIFFQGAADQAIEKYYLLQSSSRSRKDPSASYVEEEEIRPRPDRIVQDPARGSLPAWPPPPSVSQFEIPVKQESKFARLTQLTICDSNGNPCQIFPAGEEAWFFVEYELKANAGVPVAGISLKTVQNLLVHGKTSLHHQLQVPTRVEEGSRLRFMQAIRLNLAPGNYIFNLSLWAMHPEAYARIGDMPPAEINENLLPLLSIKRAGNIEVLPARHGKTLWQRHTGVCDLAGKLHFEIINRAD